MMFAGDIDATATVGVECRKLADKQIEPAVVVVIKPDRGRIPAGSFNAGLPGYIGKSSIAVIVVKNAFAALCNVDVGRSVIVIVSNRYALSKAAPANTGFFSHVRECSVAIVAIERVAYRTGWSEKA